MAAAGSPAAKQAVDGRTGKAPNGGWNSVGESRRPVKHVRDGEGDPGGLRQLLGADPTTAIDPPQLRNSLVQTGQQSAPGLIWRAASIGGSASPGRSSWTRAFPQTLWLDLLAAAI
jgi:hypothetical protein